MLPGLTLCGFWGFELRFSYLPGKYFTNSHHLHFEMTLVESVGVRPGMWRGLRLACAFHETLLPVPSSQLLATGAFPGSLGQYPQAASTDLHLMVKDIGRE